jgi:hypothetical protein
VRPEPVDDRAPVTAPGGGAVDLCPERRHQRPGRPGPRLVPLVGQAARGGGGLAGRAGNQKGDRGRDRLVGPGQEATAGDGVDRAVEPGVVEGHDDVHRRQAGADESHGATGGQVLQCARLPGVAHGTAGLRRQRLRARRVPEGEDDRVGPQSAAVGEFEPHSIGAGHDSGNPSPDGGERRAAPRLLDLMVEAPLQVLAVEAAGQERTGVRLRAARAGPVDEVARVVGVGAHAGRRDVEEMGVAGRVVGDAATQPRAFFDEHDSDRGAVAEQLGRGEQAAGSATDDGDGRRLQPGSGGREGAEVFD